MSGISNIDDDGDGQVDESSIEDDDEDELDKILAEESQAGQSTDTVSRSRSASPGGFTD